MTNTRYEIEFDDGTTLDVTTAADPYELDGTFTAICNDTGERLRINGWLAVRIDEVDENGDYLETVEPTYAPHTYDDPRCTCHRCRVEQVAA